MPNCRVLIVDDTRDVRRVLRAALETVGFPVQITDVPSGEEAILVISRQPVDVLISDVRLPGISGLELIERARVRNPNLKLVLITGMTDEKVRRQVEMAQADAFFFKPIEIKPFLETMGDLLGMESQAGPIYPAAPVNLRTPPAPIESIASVAAKAKSLLDVFRKTPPPVSAPAVPPKIELEDHDTRPIDQARARARLAEEARRAAARAKSPEQLVQEQTTTLYKQLQAAFVIVTNLSGEFLAQEGTVVQAVQTIGWTAVLEASAGFASSPIGALKGVVFLPGEDYDFLLARVTPQILLLVGAGHGTWNDQPFGRLSEAIWAAAGDIRAAGLQGSELYAAEALGNAAGDPSDDVQGAGAALPDLDALFEKIRVGGMQTANIDEFWNTAAEDYSAHGGRSNGITFDEAQQLGLAPEDD